MSGVISYREYGAIGDGITDDFDAIVRAHEAAGASGAAVRADAGARYYIGGADKTAVIQTDTDWGDAEFFIDDTRVENRGSHIFKVASRRPPVPVTHIKALTKGQAKLPLELGQDALITVTDDDTMRFIREGPNQDGGTPQTDVFLVNKNGEVDPGTPLIWDFTGITSMTARPVDGETLTVRGGRFTTTANRDESKYTYYARGIGITRSNVVIDGITHAVTDEGEQGAPYGGFINISSCAHVTVQNCTLTGHKTYTTTGSAGVPVAMGTYDINVYSAVNVTFKDCRQFTCIHDTSRWGIFGSNHCKNLTFDGVEFSRFDAHMGVTNAAVRNSVLGHMGMKIIGRGVFLAENTKVHGREFIGLRPDYGSTWEGEVVIRDCEFFPAAPDVAIINGQNSGRHDFGYPCFMPRKITIDGFIIHDGGFAEGYAGPKLFGAFNDAGAHEESAEKYPYAVTEEVSVRNLTAASGMPLVISGNARLPRRAVERT
jgi:hypothetical protein